MKTLINVFSILCLFFIVGCEKDAASESSFYTEEVTENMVNGSWTILKMVDSGKEETHHFAGYQFDFKSDGTVSARKDDHLRTGNWRISNDSSDDDNGNDLEFHLSFNASDHFEELNDDWDIITHNAQKIELIDISGGNGGTDYLTFVR